MPNTELIAQLLARLRGPESLEVEFKRGRGGLPKDLWPTVSAFANTSGGWVLIGVQEVNGRAVLDDLPNPEARLQDFYNQIRNPQKVSYPICGADDAKIQAVDDKPLLVIRVPAASRKHRPVYIGSSPYGGTYLRRNSGDYPCTKAEVDRMMRDASEVSADSAILDGFSLEDLDPDALARYRRRYQTENPGSPWNGYDDRRFLRALGGYRKERLSDREGLTVAGLLLFGLPEALREWRGRHLIDFRRLPADGSVQERWTDRVAWDGHLFGAFEAIYPKLVRDLPNPFHLRDAVRRGQGPAQDAMRESLVNLLVHADYAETDASIVFRHDQGCRFQNPGNSRISKQDLLHGDRSDPRNPILVAAFRHIGLADEAGTGIPKILRAWHELGLKPPDIDVGTERYEFTLRLRNVHFLSDEDRAWLAALGVLDDEPKQLALVHAKEFGSVDNPQLCKLSGQHSSDATKTLTGLRDDGWFSASGSGRGTYWELSDRALAALDEVRGLEQRPSHPDLFEVELSGPTPAPGTHGLDHNAEVEGPGTKTSSLGTKEDSPGSKPSLVPKPTSFPGSPLEWETLSDISAVVRERERVRAGRMEEVVVALCSVAPLAISELVKLTGKGPDRVREVVQSLRGGNGEGESLRYLYPDTPSTPKQRYVAA